MELDSNSAKSCVKYLLTLRLLVSFFIAMTNCDREASKPRSFTLNLAFDC